MLRLYCVLDSFFFKLVFIGVSCLQCCVNFRCVPGWVNQPSTCLLPLGLPSHPVTVVHDAVFPVLQSMFSCMHAKSLQLCPTLCDCTDYSPLGSSVHRILHEQNTGMGYRALLQRIFLIQRLNATSLCLLHWQAGSLPLVPPGKPMFSLVIYFKHGIHSAYV